LNETLDDDIAYLLLDFTLERQAFCLKELAPYTNSNLSLNMLEIAFDNDPRFIWLSSSSPELKLYITKRALCLHFVRLTISLAKKRQARLCEAELASFMDDMRTDDNHWSTPPREAIAFGEKLGFIGRTWTASEYIFPLAHVLALTSPNRIEMAGSLLYKFAETDYPEIPTADLPARLIEEELGRLGARISYVVKEREGFLTGKKLTLEEIGNHLNLTRERVRQIENKFWNTIKYPLNSLPFIQAMVYDIIARQGSLIVQSNTPEAHLRQFITKCLNIPHTLLSHTNICVTGLSPGDMAMFYSPKWLSGEVDVQRMAARLDSSGKLTLIADDTQQVAQRLVDFVRDHLQRIEKVALALRSIGRPAHYSEVTEAYNSMFPDDPANEHNVHAMLGREKHGIVWIGVRGTYALIEWGFERPSTTLFQTVTEIVKKIYAETSQPVPFHVIVAEIGKYRKITRPASLTIAAHCNPDLRRVSKDSFVPASSEKETGEQISAKELDRILREFESGKIQ